MAKVKGLYKRGRVWWIRYAGPDGKIRFESSRSSSFKGAQALLIERKKAHSSGFRGKGYLRSSKASRGEDLDIEEPVCGG
jgi:hypothetical protein